MTRARAFTALEFTARFNKSFRRLSAGSQAQCEEALAQLLEEPLAPGLHLKPIRPSNSYWEARISRGDRLILYPVGTTAYVMDVVKHDEIRRWGTG